MHPLSRTVAQIRAAVALQLRRNGRVHNGRGTLGGTLEHDPLEPRYVRGRRVHKQAGVDDARMHGMRLDGLASYAQLLLQVLGEQDLSELALVVRHWWIRGISGEQYRITVRNTWIVG